MTAVAANTIRSASVDDCWNRVGVRGNRSCPLLQEHIHCRNCPVHSATAKALLDVPADAAYRESWTKYFAERRAPPKTQQHSVLIFRLGTEWLALPTLLCAEITALRPIHSLPHRRDGVVLGLANVRGELLVCVALGVVLDLPAHAETPAEQRAAASQRFIVISREAANMILPVDAVHGVHRYDKLDLKDVPATVARAQATYTKALIPWEGKFAALLDEQLLFYTIQRHLT